MPSAAFPPGCHWTRVGEHNVVCGSFSLLHDHWLLLANAGQSLLNAAREVLMAGELDLRVFLGHLDRAVAGDLRSFDA